MGDCFLMGHGGYALPKLNNLQNVNLTDYSQSATFSISFAKQGRPKKYTYKWYISEDNATWTTITENGNSSLVISGMDYRKEQYWIKCAVSNKKGTVESNIATLTLTPILPYFTYMVNGIDQAKNTSYVVQENSGNNWKLKFLKSGVLNIINRGSAINSTVDMFLVGGGGGGGGSSLSGDAYGGGGGGGGEVSTLKNQNLKKTSYDITIGAGGSGGASRGSGEDGNYGDSGSSGGKTIIQSDDLSQSADGGKGGVASSIPSGGSGGSGGGGGSVGWSYYVDEAWGQYWESYAGVAGKGGSNGENGTNAKHPHTGEDQGGKGGTGKNQSTYEFGESSSNKRYSGGGAGGYAVGIRQLGVSGRPASAKDGGGSSGANATSYGGGGGGGNYDYGHSTINGEAKGGNGYQGIVIIRNHQ